MDSLDKESGGHELLFGTAELESLVILFELVYSIHAFYLRFNRNLVLVQEAQEGLPNEQVSILRLNETSPDFEAAGHFILPHEPSVVVESDQHGRRHGYLELKSLSQLRDVVKRLCSGQNWQLIVRDVPKILLLLQFSWQLNHSLHPDGFFLRLGRNTTVFPLDYRVRRLYVDAFLVLIIKRLL